MSTKLDWFLKCSYKKELYDAFKKDVSLIKLEAEKLEIPYESYHPYYLLVYSYLKTLLDEGIIVNDKFARGAFHRVWNLAESTDDLRTTLQFEYLLYSKYGQAVCEKSKSSKLFDLDTFQYERNIKRLHLIVESIRNEAVESGRNEIGLLDRIAFFYNTLCFQDPSFTCEMNKLWEKLNKDLNAPNQELIFDKLLLLSDVVKKTFETNMKCFLCMFGAVTFKTEPDFYRHCIITHTSLRLTCKEEKCNDRAINQFRLEYHMKDRHTAKWEKQKVIRKCNGCGKGFTLLKELNQCEENCIKEKPHKFSIYYWEKYYLLSSEQNQDGANFSQTYSSCFFPSKPKPETASLMKDEVKGKQEEEEEDYESYFNASFGSDFGSSSEEVKTDAKAEAPVDSVTKVEDVGFAKVDIAAVKQAKDEARSEASEAQKKDDDDSVTRKRKSENPVSTKDDEVMELKKALIDQQEYFKTELEKVNGKVDKMFALITTMNEYLVGLKETRKVQK